MELPQRRLPESDKFLERLPTLKKRTAYPLRHILFLFYNRNYRFFKWLIFPVITLYRYPSMVWRIEIPDLSAGVYQIPGFKFAINMVGLFLIIYY